MFLQLRLESIAWGTMRLVKSIFSVLWAAIVLTGPARAQVKINEIMINDLGSDNSTYVELYGLAGASLAGYQLVGVNGANGSEYNAISLSGVIPADGFFVIGQSASVPNVDFISDSVNYQNGPDNILLKVSGLVVDAVGYGSFTGPDTFFVGEGSSCANPTEGGSLSRYPDGHDTDNNAADFTQTPLLTPGTPNTLPGQPPFYSLIQLRTNPPPLDEVFWTGGIATADAGLFNGPLSISAYMQDDLAGINLSGGSFDFASGDCLWVKALWDEYNGLLTLHPILELHVGSEVAVPFPQEINCGIANTQGEALESMLVLLHSVWITLLSESWPGLGSNADLTICDSTGQTIALRIDKDTDLDGWLGHPDAGEPFDLRGILSQYGVHQILPRGQSDINPETAVQPDWGRRMPAGFRLETPHPNPFNAATVVRFSLTQPDRIKLQAFSVDGRQAATLAFNNYAAGDYQVVWKADGFPSGLYILRLQTRRGTLAAKALLLR